MSKRSHSLIFILLFSMFLIVGCGGAEPFIYDMNGGAANNGTVNVGAPGRLVATVNESQVNLSWAPVAGASSYTVYMSTYNTLAVNTFDELADGRTFSSTDPSLAVTDLVFDTSYYFLVTASNNNGEGSASNVISAKPNTIQTAIIHVAGHGDITIELFEANAPITVANFVKYAEDGFYIDTLFHRVIDNFMIQGGGYDRGNTIKDTRNPIKNESDNLLSNLTGTIAMARLPAADSATAQFFINVADNTSLDYVSDTKWGYTVFGRVTSGMDVVNVIKDVSVGANDLPVNEVLISSVDIIDPLY